MTITWKDAHSTPKGPLPIVLLRWGSREPLHVHVERDDCEAKFWLDPVRLSRSHRFTAKEINKIEKLIVEHHQDLLDSWNEFFNG